MNPTLEAAWRASLARVSARAADLMVEHDDISVTACLHYAMAEEVLLRGVPGDMDRPNVVGRSPLQSLMENLNQ